MPEETYLQVSKSRPATGQNRRRGFRVSAAELPLKTWRMEPHERLIDRPLPSRRVNVRGVDLGNGGIGVLFAAPDEQGFSGGLSPTISLGDRLRIEIPGLKADDEPIVYEGRVNYVRTLDTEEVRVGIEFVPSGSPSLARRATEALAKLLASMQRSELRQKRMARDAA